MSNLTMLKIKLKHLAAESKIIRHQEMKMRGKWGYDSQKFTLHRKDVVRPEARATHLAYGYLRGLTYTQIEATTKSAPNWENVKRMVKKYGTRQDLENFDGWEKGVLKSAA